MGRMPTLFIGHGSPMNAIEDNDFSRQWMSLGERLPRPEAILAISAHWFTAHTRVTNASAPKMVYDMYGFPEELYEVVYAAPGAPAFAARVQELLGEVVRVDNSWGLDHGAWSVLRRLYPAADIPVFQLSVDKDAGMEQHYRLGQALAPLREEGVLILGSGNVVHNLARLNWAMEDGYDWAKEFDGYIKKNILTRNDDNVIAYAKAGACADMAFSWPDHFAPLLYALGAAAGTEQVSVLNNRCTLGSLSMTSYVWDNP